VPSDILELHDTTERRSGSHPRTVRRLLLTFLGRGESKLAAILSFLSPFSYRKLNDEFKQDDSGQIH